MVWIKMIDIIKVFVLDNKIFANEIIFKNLIFDQVSITPRVMTLFTSSLINYLNIRPLICIVPTFIMDVTVKFR